MPTMLICLDCQRTNAPWAKKCTACKADLHTYSANTLISSHPSIAIDKRNPLEQNSTTAEVSADIKTWSPDTEWHSLDEIDGEKVLDNETIEPISVIEPSRTSEIDWGNSREETEKFDSSPIHADSKNRFDEYGYDFERANKSAWKTTAILLSGILGILIAGGLAISYLHSTTIPTSPKLVNTTTDKNGKANNRASGVVAPAGGQQRTQANDVVMTEEVISVTKPMDQDINQVDSAKQNAQLIKSANSQQEISTVIKPPVFVMSASEPIMAKPEAGKIATSTKKPDPIPTIIQKQAAVEVAPKSNKPVSAKPDTRNTPYPVLVPVPLRPSDSRTGSDGSQSSAINESPSPIAVAPIQAAASSAPSRLKEKQASECSNSAFLGKVLCEERSRVNFCSNRWNTHPDCQVNSNKLEP
jgi:hypothetical protein